MKVKQPDDMWPPGFRFHPTDEELILYYLKRKICRKRLKLDIIAETDVYRWDPEELPGQSLLKTGDRQWFFFSPRDRKYPNGARSNRATRLGYWKATGKDRTIACNSRNVGVKKTLVFYRGRAPNGERTDWVMHEYTLDEEELKRCQNMQDYYALYKVFKKSGPGPKNGEQYGAPFKEEDWVDDECQDVLNNVDREMPGKQLIEAAPVNDAQVPSLLDDFEEYIRQIADEPVNEQPQVVSEEENQSTLVQPSSREVLFPEPIRVVNKQASFEFSQSASYNLQQYEASEVTSVPKNSEQPLQFSEEDFLEMDDLIGPEPTISNFEKPVENLQLGDFDGLSELDLFHDAAMFLNDMGPIDQEAVSYQMSGLGDNMVNQVDYQFQFHSEVNKMGHQLQQNPMVNQMDHQLQSNSMFNQMDHQLQSNNVTNQIHHQLQPWMYDDQIGDMLTPVGSSQGILCPQTSGLAHEPTNHPTQSVNQNQDGQEEGGGTTSWVSSSLWAFVESIPTTPASAAESPLVNRAFERMSSFSRVRLNVKNTTNVAGGNGAVMVKQAGSSRGFFLLSMIGVLCAILWMLMGTVRIFERCISS